MEKIELPFSEIIFRLTSRKTKSQGKRLTPFEWRVLATTCLIPMGQTRSYQWIARKIGKPKAMRAVGQALGKNPFPLLIPCHRVVRENGSLGGYTGGLQKKKLLLALETAIAKKSLNPLRSSSALV